MLGITRRFQIGYESVNIGSNGDEFIKGAVI